MTRTLRWVMPIAMTLVLALVSVACSSDDGGSGSSPGSGDDQTSSAEEESTPSTIPEAVLASLDAPDEPGPYAVGRRTVELNDTDRDRSLVSDIWYPVDPGTTGDPSVYEFLPGISYASEAALADVAISGDAPFPLVIYSHGSGGLRYIATFYTELLASHGFVVASLDHVGNTAVDSIAGTTTSREETAYNRTVDVEFLIDEMLAASERDGDPLSGSIDPERIGVSGHSFGAFTALAAAGGYENVLGGIAPDGRVDAVAAMAPASRLNSDEELRAIDVPTLILSGTLDETTPIDPDTERAWELVGGRPLWRVDITDAGHQSFTDVCAYQELLPTLGDVPEVLVDTVDEFAEEGCAEGLVPIDEARDLINRATVSFMLAYVAGQTDYVGFLADAAPGETVRVKE